MSTHDFANPDLTSLQDQINELQSQIQILHNQTNSVLEMAKTFHTSLNSHVIAQAIIKTVTTSVPVDSTSVCLYNQKEETLDIIGALDCRANPLPQPQANIPLLLKILTEGQLYYQPSAPWQASNLILCLPMQYDHHKVGTINIHSLSKACLNTAEIQLLTTIADHASSALYNSILYTATQRESITDELTGLYNRRFFQKRLQEQISLFQRTKYSWPFGLILLDVDNFKKFNDQYGHPFGDIVLQNISKVLSANLRKEDTLARYGGEEFIILLPHASSRMITELSEKIRQVVANSPALDPVTDQQASVTISLGATLMSTTDTILSVVKRADQALYQAKAEGRNQSIFLPHQ